MSTRVVGRPEVDEIPSHLVGYVKKVPESDPVMVLAAQIEDTATLLRGLSDTQAMHRYAHGKWSVKEVVGHVADVVLGKAIVSRSDGRSAISMTMRSRPKAMPPCGGQP